MLSETVQHQTSGATRELPSALRFISDRPRSIGASFMYDFMPPFNFNTPNEANVFEHQNFHNGQFYRERCLFPIVKAKWSSAIAHKIPTRYVPIASTERRKRQEPAVARIPKGRHTLANGSFSVTSVETKWINETRDRS
jgi:hypothetical protein